MGYRRITLDVVVHEDDVEVFTQALRTLCIALKRPQPCTGAGSQTPRPESQRTRAR